MEVAARDRDDDVQGGRATRVDTARGGGVGATLSQWTLGGETRAEAHARDEQTAHGGARLGVHQRLVEPRERRKCPPP